MPTPEPEAVSLPGSSFNVCVSYLDSLCVLSKQPVIRVIYSDNLFKFKSTNYSNNLLHVT